MSLHNLNSIPPAGWVPPRPVLHTHPWPPVPAGKEWHSSSDVLYAGQETNSVARSAPKRLSLARIDRRPTGLGYGRYTNRATLEEAIFEMFNLLFVFQIG